METQLTKVHCSLPSGLVWHWGILRWSIVCCYRQSAKLSPVASWFLNLGAFACLSVNLLALSVSFKSAVPVHVTRQVYI